MSKITNWTPTVCRDVADEITASLTAIEEKYGIKIKRKGGGSYDGGSFTFKLEACTTSTDGQVNSKEATDFKRQATFYGLKPEYLEQEVILSGERVKIIGLSTRSRKYPILGTRLRDGKTYKYTSLGVQNAFKLKEMTESS